MEVYFGHVCMCPHYKTCAVNENGSVLFMKYTVLMWECRKGRSRYKYHYVPYHCTMDCG